MKNEKAKHTPWIVLKVGDKRRSSDDGLLDRIVTERYQVGICDCVPSESALIAAAPELLAALEMNLELAEKGMESKNQYWAVLKVTRAAIAKAKGE